MRLRRGSWRMRPESRGNQQGSSIRVYLVSKSNGQARCIEITHTPSVSTPAASTCLPLRLSSRMLTHGNPTGIEDHGLDNLERVGGQAVSSVFFAVVLAGDTGKERRSSLNHVVHTRKDEKTKGKKKVLGRHGCWDRRCTGNLLESG